MGQAQPKPQPPPKRGEYILIPPLFERHRKSGITAWEYAIIGRNAGTLLGIGHSDLGKDCLLLSEFRLSPEKNIHVAGKLLRKLRVGPSDNPVDGKLLVGSKLDGFPQFEGKLSTENGGQFKVALALQNEQKLRAHAGFVVENSDDPFKGIMIGISNPHFSVGARVALDAVKGHGLGNSKAYAVAFLDRVAIGVEAYKTDDVERPICVNGKLAFHHRAEDAEATAYELVVEALDGRKVSASFYQHMVLRRRNANPFEPRAKTILNYVDFGVGVEHTLRTETETAKSNVSVAARWQINRGNMIRARVDKHGLDFQYAGKFWSQPALTVRPSAHWDFPTSDKPGFSAPRFGVQILVDNWGEVMYEKPPRQYRETERNVEQEDVYFEEPIPEPRQTTREAYARF
eukprot:TRINITY_DN6296_c0_g1_i2.p1 TRINITY_DN6296_c0_g1~~TRINITY_DN6296_c0_g1_i2.p1  ORF type:complete len:401 (+),score=77.75 TRINITY_DN6296_c0_g1_i2:3-1205(+)